MRTLSMAAHALLTLALAAGCAASGVPAQRGATPGPPLEHTSWTLVDLGGLPARAAQNMPVPYLELDPATAQARGSTGCNSFSRRYELRGDSLGLGPLASTRRACLDPEMNRQETAFLEALGGTRTWRVRGDTIVLAGEAGPVARFAAQDQRERGR